MWCLWTHDHEKPQSHFQTVKLNLHSEKKFSVMLISIDQQSSKSIDEQKSKTIMTSDNNSANDRK